MAFYWFNEFVSIFTRSRHHSETTLAAEYMGHDKQRVDRNQRRDKTFRPAVESRLYSRERIARHYRADLLKQAREDRDQLAS